MSLFADRLRALDELVRVLAQFRVFIFSFLHFLMSPDMFMVIAVVSAFGSGAVAVMYWQLHRQFTCLHLELHRLSRQYRRTRQNCIRVHQRLNTVEESQAELMRQDDFSAPYWRAGSSLSKQQSTESD